MTSTYYAKPLLGWRDIAELFGYGRSNALLLMHEIGVIHIGHNVFVRATDLDAYLEEKCSIDISWPKSASRRKGARHER